MRLRQAIARASTSTLDPRYSGGATKRYGPDEVTSRALFRCPAAQMRIASPAAATDMPIAIDRSVGSASTITSTPNTQPRATRSRASAATSVSNMARLWRQAAIDCGDHLRRLDVEQAHARQPAAAQMMTPTDRVTRYGDVERRHRTVSHRPRRPVD